MANPSDMASTIKDVQGHNFDLAKIEELIMAVVQAAPAISQGVMTAAPFVQAVIALYAHGGNPTEEEWAGLKLRLNVNSAMLVEASTNHSTDEPTASKSPPPPVAKPAVAPSVKGK